MPPTALPEALLHSLKDAPGFEKEPFLRVHESGEQVVSVRYNPLKYHSVPGELPDGATRVPWSSCGYYLPSRPSFTLDPLLHAGAYYVQEASSMFIEQCLKQTTDTAHDLKVLDLCAAPGGKSTLLQSLLSPHSLLVCNEVIKARVNTLTENMIKWGADNVIVTNNDPRDFARMPAFFDIILVDAPCSGSGLFRKDPDAIEEWSENLVQTCSQRQERILDNILPSLKPGGLLIYSTCSYSIEEDEQICDWLVEKQHLRAVSLEIPREWNVTVSYSRKYDCAGYRFYPDKIKGEGFFAACFRKDETPDGEEGKRTFRDKLTKLSRQEVAVVQPFLRDIHGYHFYHLETGVFAFQKMMEQELIAVTASLYVKKAGILCGKLAHAALIPDHELALSTIINDKIQSIILEKGQALQYLRREEVTVETDLRGWTLARYKNLSLGWMKILPNRINNYYPKEWRILKTGIG